MSLQFMLDSECLAKLPRVSIILNSYKIQYGRDFNHYVLQKCMNSAVCIDDMTTKELTNFENELIDGITYKGNKNENNHI